MSSMQCLNVNVEVFVDGDWGLLPEVGRGKTQLS